MKKFREISEQYREEGRHKLVYPKNKPVVSPRPESDSAKAKLKEAIKDKFDIGEYDQEGDMAKSDLRSILANAKRVHDMLKDDDNLPEWVQSKITKAEDYMSTVANYLEAEMNEEAGASKKKEEKFHMELDKLVHKTFGHSPAEKKEKMNEAVKMPKQTRAEKEYRRITGKTVDQRLSELDKIQKNLAKQREDYIKQGIIKAEEVEIEEGIGGTIAGGIGQFIGNKIDPLHGEIMRAHGEVAGRAAEYTIRKHLNKLHTALKKHLSSGTVSEEVEELDEGKYGAFRVRMTSGGPKLPRRGYGYVPQGDKDPRTGLPLGFSHPPQKDEPKKVKEEVEQLDEDTAEFHKEMMAHHKKHESDYRTIRHYNDQNSIRGGTKHGYADTTGDVVDNERAHAEARDAHEAAYEAHKNNHKNKHELSKKANELTQALHKKHEHENVALVKTPKLKSDNSVNPHKVGSIEYRKHEQQRRQNNKKHMEDHINAMKELGKSSPTKQMARNIHHGLKLSHARQHTPIKENAMRFNNNPPNAEEQQKHKEAIANELNKKRRLGTKPIKPEQITHHSVSSTVTGVQAHTYKVQHHNNPAIKMPSHTLHTITPGGNVQSGEVRLRGMTKEEVEQLDEKNAPTNPELWSRAKAMAKAKFDVYPSAYANGWAAKWYKSKGGGWKSVNEEKEKDDLPFTPDKPKKKSVVVGKKPEGYSVARQLARQAMQRYTKPVKEEKDMSKKAKIVKDVIKKTSDEKFNADPMISQSVIRNN